MCTTTAPATAAEALGMLESALGTQQRVLGFLAAQDAGGLPAPAVADQLRALERATRSEPPSGGGCWRSSIPGTGTWPAGNAPPGPG